MHTSHISKSDCWFLLDAILFFISLACNITFEYDCLTNQQPELGPKLSCLFENGCPSLSVLQHRSYRWLFVEWSDSSDAESSETGLLRLLSALLRFGLCTWENWPKQKILNTVIFMLFKFSINLKQTSWKMWIWHSVLPLPLPVYCLFLIKVGCPNLNFGLSTSH